MVTAEPHLQKLSVLVWPETFAAQSSLTTWSIWRRPGNFASSSA